jgi:hypothetical protein
MKTVSLSTFMQREWPDKGRTTKGNAIVSLRSVGVYPGTICDLRSAKQTDLTTYLFLSTNTTRHEKT